MHTERYSGFVWIISSLALFAYGILTFFGQKAPGVEQIVTYLGTVESGYVYGAAFVSILIEGLYIFGNFFPGSTLVVILAIISQSGGVSVFFFTMFAIYLGWCVTGAINIALAQMYDAKFQKGLGAEESETSSQWWLTWYPPFRANHEVSMTLNSKKPYATFLSSSLYKLAVTVILFGLLALVPLFVDITEISNEEGVISIFLFAIIGLVVGIKKLQK